MKIMYGKLLLWNENEEITEYTHICYFCKKKNTGKINKKLKEWVT